MEGSCASYLGLFFLFGVSKRAITDGNKVTSFTYVSRSIMYIEKGTVKIIH